MTPAQQNFEDWLTEARVVRGEVTLAEFREQIAKVAAARIVEAVLLKELEIRT